MTDREPRQGMTYQELTRQTAWLLIDAIDTLVLHAKEMTEHQEDAIWSARDAAYEVLHALRKVGEQPYELDYPKLVKEHRTA